MASAQLEAADGRLVDADPPGQLLLREAQTLPASLDLPTEGRRQRLAESAGLAGDRGRAAPHSTRPLAGPCRRVHAQESYTRAFTRHYV